MHNIKVVRTARGIHILLDGKNVTTLSVYAGKKHVEIAGMINKALNIVGLEAEIQHVDQTAVPIMKETNEAERPEPNKLEAMPYVPLDRTLDESEEF